MESQRRSRREVSVVKEAPKIIKKADPVVDDTSEEDLSLDIYGVSETPPDTFSSGCCLLDQVLGGGWAYNRISNIVGNHSSGKTLLAIEAAANFILENPDGSVIYVEAEAAFDMDYAASLGLPVEQVDFVDDAITVEDVFEDLEDRFGGKTKTLYIIDSLDALSDREEQDRKIDAGSYAMTKQKKLSELFRRMVKRLKQSNITLMVISQVREAIGVVYGDKLRRSGGKAMDFYASQVLWLKHIKRLEPTKKGIKRTIGVQVQAKCKKNKIAPPFREANLPILFSFGVDSLSAGLAWLIEAKRTDSIDLSEVDAKKLLAKTGKLTKEEYLTELANVDEAVAAVWREVDEGFEVGFRKYG